MAVEVKMSYPMPDFSEYPDDYYEHCKIVERGDFKEGYNESRGMAPEIAATISRMREENYLRHSQKRRR